MKRIHVTIRTKENSAEGRPRLKAGIYERSSRKTVSSSHWLRLLLPLTNGHQVGR